MKSMFKVMFLSGAFITLGAMTGTVSAMNAKVQLVPKLPLADQQLWKACVTKNHSLLDLAFKDSPNVNVQIGDEIPLVLAIYPQLAFECKSGHLIYCSPDPKIVRLLIDNGANVHFRNSSSGQTVLDFVHVELQDHPEFAEAYGAIIAMLVAAGARRLGDALNVC